MQRQLRLEQRPATDRCPTVDDVAMLCLLVDADGCVRWANEAALRLLRAAVSHVTRPTVAALVHGDERPALAATLADAVDAGGADLVVRLGSSPSEDGGRYVHLVLSREDSGPDVRSGPNVEILVQGWDVSLLMGRLHDLEAQGRRDPLTGLAHRVAFMDRLRHEVQHSASSGTDVAVLFADVDGFTAVNDAFGHEVGDTVLVEIGRRLRESLRPGELAARIGGDEFAVICPDLTDPQQAMTAADRLRGAVAEPMEVLDRERRMTLSVGVAFASGHDRGDPVVSLVRRAGLAMDDRET